MTSPYVEALGPRFAQLPAPCRALHLATSGSSGTIDVTVAKAHFARWLARGLGLPPGGRAQPLWFEMQASGQGAWWVRKVGEHEMRSFMRACPSGRVVEKLGAVCVHVELVPDEQALNLVPERVTLLGVPLPRFLWPRMAAREWAEGDLYCFDVRLALPLGGPLLVAYSGHLRTMESADAPGAGR